jgi:hypothetical protein
MARQSCHQLRHHLFPPAAKRCVLLALAMTFQLAEPAILRYGINGVIISAY